MRLGEAERAGRQLLFLVGDGREALRCWGERHRMG